MSHVGSCVAVFPLHSCENILEVIKQLQAVDYSNRQLSVIGVQREQEEFWHNLQSVLVGGTFIQIPELGFLTVAGGLSTTINIGVPNKIQQYNYTELGKLLYLVGVPESSFQYYEAAIKAGQFILIAYGENLEIESAGNLLELSSSVDVSLHLLNTS